MEIVEIQAESRPAAGRRVCRRLRREGKLPAVLYGRGEDNVMLTLDQLEMEHLISSHTFVARVSWDGRSEDVQIKDFQYDALGDHLLHVDFVRISLTEKLTVAVPIETEGDPVGVEAGGVLTQELYELEIECLPTNIPDQLVIQIGHLEINDTARVEEIELPEGVTTEVDPDTVVVVVAPPVEEEEEEEMPEDILAEPELIGREAEEEEELEEED
jgi:large subunit ribosomal protein L25